MTLGCPGDIRADEEPNLGTTGQKLSTKLRVGMSMAAVLILQPSPTPPTHMHVATVK